MKQSTASPMHSEMKPSGGTDRSALRESARWWERRRVPYNVVLTAVFVALAARTWPRLQPELTSAAVLPLLVLALLANLVYCVGYLVDLPVQGLRDPRTRLRWRWALWLTGTLLAVLVETYWFLDEILPPIV